MRTNPTFGKVIAGGVAGTVAMTAVMYGVAPMMGVHMDIAALLGTMLGGSWIAGLAMHVMNGAVVFPALYLFGFRRLVPGPEVFRGLALGAGLWLLSQLVVMPMMGAGVFSSEAGGMMAAVGSLMGHLLYGGLLGLVSGGSGRAV